MTVLSEPASECGASESVASTSKAADDPKAKLTRPKHLDLLPPAPKKDGKRVNQVVVVVILCIKYILL